MFIHFSPEFGEHVYGHYFELHHIDCLSPFNLILFQRFCLVLSIEIFYCLRILAISLCLFLCVR